MQSNPSLSGSTQSLVLTNRRAMKAPAPPPPTYRQTHGPSRKISDPGFDQTHRRSPSDPPPLPAKTGAGKANLPGEFLCDLCGCTFMYTLGIYCNIFVCVYVVNGALTVLAE